MAKLFDKKVEGADVKVKKDDDSGKIEADKYTPTGGKTHVHQNYKLDTTSGAYKEYSGGENSDDRTYNKEDKK